MYDSFVIQGAIATDWGRLNGCPSAGNPAMAGVLPAVVSTLSDIAPNLLHPMGAIEPMHLMDGQT